MSSSHGDNKEYLNLKAGEGGEKDLYCIISFILNPRKKAPKSINTKPEITRHKCSNSKISTRDLVYMDKLGGV